MSVLFGLIGKQNLSFIHQVIIMRVKELKSFCNVNKAFVYTMNVEVKILL